MFNSTVLEVMIGMSFCYAAISLMTSSIQEAIASLFDLRSKTLLNSILTMLNEIPPRPDTPLTLALYNHALVNPHSKGDAASIDQLDHRPSYIDPHHFGTVIVEVLAGTTADWATLGAAIDGIQNEQLRRLFKGMYDRSNQSIEVFRTSLANWFDASMERLSGIYKRNAQLWSFAVAFVIAGLFNIDSFSLFATLWKHPAAVAQLAIPSQAGSSLSQAMDGLQQLPIGWTSALLARTGWAVWLLTVTGWAVTALSVLFGAPFWFDLLQRFVHVRGTGIKPASRQAPPPLPPQ